MHRRLLRAALLLALPLLVADVARAQNVTVDDPVLRAIWQEGTEQSQVARLGQVLMDSIGPRLAGTPNMKAARDWVEQTYRGWGIPVRQERYGTWRGWAPVSLHVDLVAPRAQTLVAHLLAWSAGAAKPVEGAVVLLPEAATRAEFDAWLPTARGKFVLTTPPEPMCRARQELEKFALPETVKWADSVRGAARRGWSRRLAAFEGDPGDALKALDSAGAAGVLSSNWSGGWGATRVFSGLTRRAVALDLSCEDYGLLARLAANGQGPRIRVAAQARELGEVPEFNVVAELRGSEKPDEYVLLGAHLDSWHGATGATDNGTGSVMMLEAARLLKAAYPNPRRTILIGHWGAEEQGLIGSGSFAEDHPEIVERLYASFNQDNGTWRVEEVQAYGFLSGIGHLARWLAKLPRELSGNLELPAPGELTNTGSDHYSFLCRGAPGFRLTSAYDEYRQYTWHTTLDTWDKVVQPELRTNAITVAMLAYLASEDPDPLTRERALAPAGARGGGVMRCSPASRTFRER
jgi:hypothetical protein